MPGEGKSYIVDNYKPLCIFVNGDGWAGKTTLCNILESRKVGIIKLDEIIQNIYESNDPVLMPHFAKVEPICLNIGILSIMFERTIPKYFAKKIVEFTIESAQNYPVIIMEGFTLSMPNIRSNLMQLLEDNNYVIWSLIKNSL